MKQFFVDYWPALVVAAQILLAALVFWVDTRTKLKVDAAVDPLKVRLQAIEARVDEAEGDIHGLPTKADLARVEGEVKGIHREVQLANAGIDRLEGYFLQRGVEKA